MPDSSSIRAKAVQYAIDTKLRSLESRNPALKIDKNTLKEALPLYEYAPVSGVPHHHGKSRQAPGVPIDLPLPRGPETGEDPDMYKWEDVISLTSFMTSASNAVPETNVAAGGFRTLIANSPAASGPNKSMVETEHPPWYCVGIIGAGVAGLRTAKLLQDAGIPYKILEASERHGGRLFTYEFPPKGGKGKHDYYDVGGMRFPKNDANKSTFEVFQELGLAKKLIPYVYSNPNNIRMYNNIKSTEADAATAGNHFQDETVPEEYYSKEWVGLDGKKVYGVNACAGEAFDPFRKALIDDFDSGWKKLMEYDWASTKSYLAYEMKYPMSVVNWMETRNSGTGGFDRAFSEEILDTLQFDDPGKDVDWHCLDGGSKVLVDAMLDAVNTKPMFNHRVTSIEKVTMSPHECFPNLPPTPHWPDFPFMKVSIAGKPTEYFTHVVSTSSFATLGMIDTLGVPMTYTQRQAIRTLTYGPAVKVGIRFKSRWWEKDGMKHFGGSSYTDRPSRVVVYPSAGLGEEGPGVLMAVYNWSQDAQRFGSLIKTPDWLQQLDPDRPRPPSEQLLLDQVYKDLAALHGKEEDELRKDTIDYHAFEWYHNPYTMGAFAYFNPGQFSTFYNDITGPAAHGHFHFAGEVASVHHAWVAGALDSAQRVTDEILTIDKPSLLAKFRETYGLSAVFSDEKSAQVQCIKGLFAMELEEAELKAK